MNTYLFSKLLTTRINSAPQNESDCQVLDAFREDESIEIDHDGQRSEMTEEEALHWLELDQEGLVY